MKKEFKVAFLVFISSFFIGPIGDMVHVATKTTGYPDHYAFYVLGIPWWVFPFFGFSGAAIGFNYHLLDTKFFKSKKERIGEKNFWIGFLSVLFFVFTYCLSGYLTTIHTSPLVNNLILGGLTFLLWLVIDKTWQSLVIATWITFLGILVETTLVRLNVFWYEPTDNLLFGVASWLPWLYMTLTIGVGNFMNFIFKKI